MLTPLGDYGGPVQTMHPLAGSPAILDTEDDVTRTDQRGFNLTGPPTIGAVAIGNITTVTNSFDSLRGSLRSALAAATTPGAIIRFNDSLEGSPAGIIGLASQLVIPATANGLFIDGSNFTDGLTIDANGTVEAPRRVMEIQPGATAALHGLTLTGGLVSGNGGAILNDQATLSLSACTLSGNSAGDNGGGVFSDGRNGSATLNLSSCILSSNSAESAGGGIFGTGGDEGSATLSLSACTLSGNSAVFGGGIFSDARNSGSATLSLSACTLSGNSAGAGAGIFSTGANGSATLSLSACTLSGNSAESEGGGIYGTGGATLSLSACTLSGNSAESGGGGIYGLGGDAGSVTLSLSACTLSGNSANFGGGVLLADGSSNGSTTLSLSDTILAENIAFILGPDLRELGDGATSTATGNSLLSSLEGQNTLDANEVTFLDGMPLLLSPLGDFGGPTQTMPPMLGSPAIDAAGSMNPGGTDQRGFPRFVDGALDIGAVEFQGQDTEIDIFFALDSDGDGSSNGVELAIGTEVEIADSENPRNLRITPSSTTGQPQFTFGVNQNQEEDIILRLMRSTDLISFDFTVLSNEMSPFEAGTFADPNPPEGGKAFYRLEAVRR